jgi:hypothetical protein
MRSVCPQAEYKVIGRAGGAAQRARGGASSGSSASSGAGAPSVKSGDADVAAAPKSNGATAAGGSARSKARSSVHDSFLEDAYRLRDGGRKGVSQVRMQSLCSA